MKKQQMPWCFQCQVKLVEAPVEVSYLGSTFTVELPRCPRCGQVYITEELARGKILEVEKTLESK